MLSPTLARGQFIRASRELQKVADAHPTHPRLTAIPQTLWGISQELQSRGYDEEAILVWNELVIHDPANPLAQQAAPEHRPDVSDRSSSVRSRRPRPTRN